MRWLRHCLGVVEVRVVRTDELSEDDRTRIRALLRDAFGGRFSEEDWAHCLGGWHVLAVDGDLVAHAALVERTLEVGTRLLRAGYVEGVATAPGRQHGGLGSTVMQRIEKLLRENFEVGALSTSRHGFYGRLGWKRWRGPTFARHVSELVRTADEDGGIMVLRFATTSKLDLRLPISCETRPGDDW
jgi:aminoglycoside 2'-N-acetyltransferase I